MRLIKKIILLSLALCVCILSACSTPHTEARTLWDKAWTALRDENRQSFTECFESAQDADALYTSFATARAAAAMMFASGNVVSGTEYVTATECIFDQEPVFIATISFKTITVSDSEQTLNMMLSAAFTGTGTVAGETADIKIPLLFAAGMFIPCSAIILPDPSLAVCLIETKLTLINNEWRFSGFAPFVPQV